MQKSSKQKLRSLSASVISLITVFAMAAQGAAEFVPQQSVDAAEDVPAVENAGEQAEEQVTEPESEQTDEQPAENEQPEENKTDDTEDNAPEAPEEDYLDEFEIEGTVLKKYNGERANVTVPDSVTEIGESAFAGNGGIEKVTLNADVKKIGANAFMSCSKLATLQITSNIEEIGDGAFQNSGLYGIIIDGKTFDDDRLQFPEHISVIGKNVFQGVRATNIYFGSNITKIDDSAFSGCPNLANINFKEATNLESIGNNVFSGCPSVIRVEIPDSVSKLKTIGDSAFASCGGLQSVTIESGVNKLESIGDSAFANCGGLENVTIESGVNKLISIGTSAFANCGKLKTVSLPDSIESIGSAGFINCSSLVTINLPAALKEVSVSLFEGCVSLPEIIIPSKVVMIGSKAFYNCRSLKCVNCKEGEKCTVPSSVTSIGDSAFMYCSVLPSFVVPDSVQTLGKSCFESCVELKSVMLSESLTMLSDSLFRGCLVLDKVIIPDKVTTLGTYVFEGCSALSSIVLHSNITSVGNYCFSRCMGLSSVTIQRSNENVSFGDYCFADCQSLDKMEIPDSVISMGECCFLNCIKLKNVILSDNMQTISAFLFSGCTALDNVHLPKNLIFISHDAFLNTHSLATVDLSDTKLTKINVAAFHGSGLVKIVIPDFITEIDEGGFSKCVKLSSVTLPSTLTSIGIQAFQVCESLKQISLPNSIVDVYDDKGVLEKPGIGVRAFAESGLTGITIPSRLTVIMSSVFSGCRYLKKATILGSAVKTISQQAFLSCSSLEEVTFPIVLETIGVSAFEKCEALPSVDLTKTNITEIGEAAFRECRVLESVFVPSTLSILGKSAFTNCDFLNKLDLSATVIRNIEAETFKNCEVLNGDKETGYFRLPTKLETIQKNAFENCFGLIGIDLPDTLYRICDQAFYNSGLEYIDLNQVEDISSKNSLTGQCFKSCKYLRGVKISSNMTTIPRSSFEDCESLTDAIIPRNITVIRECAFKGCKSLANLVLYDKVNAIEKEAFANCESLVNAVIPSTVQGIVKDAFKDCGSQLKISFTGSKAEWEQLVKDTDIGCTNMEYADNKTIEITTVDLVDLHKIKTRYEVDETMKASDFGDVKNIRITKTEYRYENGKLVEVKTVSTENKAITLNMVSGFDSSKEGTITLTVTYNEDYKLHYSVEIGHFVVSMEVTKLPDHLVYGLGDSSVQNVDLSGGKIKLTYSNGKSEEFNMDEVINIINSPFKVTGFNKDIEGKQTVKIWYSKKKGGTASASFEVTVKKAAAVSGEVVKMPSKLVYVKNELLDITGAEIRVHRVLEEQGYRLDYYQNVTVTSDMVGGFDSATTGVKTIHITYEELDITYDVEVVGDIRKIEWIDEPTKREYYVGDNVDISGATFRVTFEEKDDEGVYKYRDVVATNDMVFDFNSSKVGVMSPSPYIVYGDKKLLLPEITVKAIALKSLKLYKQPDKTLYGFGEPLDLTGGKLEAVYSSGETAIIDMKMDMVISTYDPRAYGQQKVTVKYGDLTVTFNVEIAVPAGLGKVVLSKGEGYEAFDTLEKALSKITATKEKCVIYIYDEINVSKMLMPAYADLTIKAVGKGKIKTTLTSIKVRHDLTLSCPFENTKGKPMTLKSTNAKNTIILEGNCGFTSIDGTGKETIKFVSDAEIKSVKKIGTLAAADGCAVTIPEKCSVKNVGKISGRIILSSGSNATILDTDNAVIELVQKSGKALPKLTLTSATGDTTIKVVDEKGTAIKLASGTLLFTAAKADDITAKIKIDPENGKDFGAVQYGKNIKAEYMQALEMGGVNYSSLEKALEKATGNAVITLKANVAVSKLNLPKTLGSLTIDGGTEKYTLLVESAVSASAKYPLIFKNMCLSAKNGALGINLTVSSGDLTLDNVSFAAKSVNLKGAKGGKALLTNCGQITALTGFDSAVIAGELTVAKTLTIPTVELASTAVLNIISGQKVTIKTQLKGEEGSKISFASGFKPVTASGTFAGKIALVGSIGSSQVFAANKTVSDDDLNKVFDLTAISATAKLKNNNGKVMVV